MVQRHKEASEPPFVGREKELVDRRLMRADPFLDLDTRRHLPCRKFGQSLHSKTHL